MSTFHSGWQAKEFLITRIVDEAQRANHPLSELERKMLYFSEIDSTPSDIAVISDEFDRTCDQGEYEKKIVRLIKKAYKRVRREPHAAYDEWWAAIRYLKSEDHYICVMIDAADLRRRWDSLKLFVAGLAVATFMFAVFFLHDKYKTIFYKYEQELFLYGWVGCVSIMIAYFFMRIIVGRTRVDNYTLKLAGRIFRSDRVK